jgi:hypothetical protein
MSRARANGGNAKGEAAMIYQLYDEIADTYHVVQPCPDCGSGNLAALWVPTEFSNGAVHWQRAIGCATCGATEGDAPTLPQAVVNWNKI